MIDVFIYCVLAKAFVYDSSSIYHNLTLLIHVEIL